MLMRILYIFSQEIYGDNGRIYQIKIYKKMLPNYGCVGATYKFTCCDTVFTSLLIFFFMLTIVQLFGFIYSFVTKTLYQAIIEIKSP